VLFGFIVSLTASAVCVIRDFMSYVVNGKMATAMAMATTMTTKAK